jgi:hypothetical protein
VRRLALLLLVSLLAGPSWSQEAPVEEPPIEVRLLVGAWAKKLGLTPVVDDALAQLYVPVPPGASWEALLEVLAFHDVIVERRPGVLIAHTRRFMAHRVAPPFRIVPPGAPLVPGDEAVTTFVPVKTRNAGDIFAAVRGLLVRDLNRFGNILYIRGPEIIVIVDLARNADYYRRCIEALDTAPPAFATRVMPVAHAPAGEVARLVRALAGVVVVADTNGEQLVVTGTSAQLDEVAALLPLLDVPAVSQERFEPAQLVAAEGFGLTLLEEPGSKGVRVVAVRAGSTAAKSELRPDDRVVAVAGKHTTSARALAEALAGKGLDPVRFDIERGGWKRQALVVAGKGFLGVVLRDDREPGVDRKSVV